MLAFTINSSRIQSPPIPNVITEATESGSSNISSLVDWHHEWWWICHNSSSCEQFKVLNFTWKPLIEQNLFVSMQHKFYANLFTKLVVAFKFFILSKNITAQELEELSLLNTITVLYTRYKQKFWIWKRK